MHTFNSNITSREIRCISTKAATIGSGHVEIIIDNSPLPNGSTENYTYFSDPGYLSVSPNVTIPAYV